MNDIILKTHSNKPLVWDMDIIKKLLNHLDLLDNIAFYDFNLTKRKLTYISHSIEQISGHPLKKFHVEGMDFLLKIIHPLDYYLLNHKSTFHICPRQDNDYKLNAFEFRIKHPVKGWIWLENNLIYLPGEKGDHQVFGAIRDMSITKEKENFLWNELNKRERDCKQMKILRDRYEKISDQQSQPEKLKSELSYLLNHQADQFLSKRQLEVLQLIGNGYSSKQLADKLNISNHTVTSHRKNLLEKFKVKNTAELIKEVSKSYWLE